MILKLILDLFRSYLSNTRLKIKPTEYPQRNTEINSLYTTFWLDLNKVVAEPKKQQ